MKAVINCVLLLLCLLAMPASTLHGRTAPGEKPDTLAFGKRFSFHTNMIDWLLGTPNATVELDLTGSPYNRLALLGGIKYNWNTHHTTNPRIVYNVFEVSGEGRYYWHTRTDGFAWEGDSTVFFLRNAWHRFRTQAARKKKPRTYRAYYVGLYAEYDKYTILLGNGIQGKGVGAGVSGGFTQPLYQMKHGSVEFEIGGRVGLRYTRYDKFSYEEESACYDYTETKQKHFVPFPVIQDVHVSLVWRMASSKDKYKWNRNRANKWDNHWAALKKKHADRVDSIRDRKLANNARKKFVADSMATEKRKKRLEDSLERVRKEMYADSVKADKQLRDSVEKAEKAMAKELKKQAERMRKDSIEAAKDSIERIKNGQLPTTEVPIDTVAHIEEVPLPEPVEVPLSEDSVPIVEPGEEETPVTEPEEENPSEESEEVPVPEVEPTAPEEPAEAEEETPATEPEEENPSEESEEVPVPEVEPAVPEEPTEAEEEVPAVEPEEENTQQPQTMRLTVCEEGGLTV